MEYVPIRTSTLRGDQQTDFDIYIKIASKYILYIREGASFEGSRLGKLKEKKLKKLYILSENEANYRNYLSANIEAAFDKSSQKSIEERGEIIQGIQESQTEELMDDPTNEIQYQTAKKGCSRFADFIMAENNAVKSILAVGNDQKSIAAHGVAVSTYAIALAERLGYKDNETLTQLALGALLHDMGMLDCSVKLGTPMSEMSVDELKEYKQHPITGARKVKDLNHFDRNVIEIILQAEETADGTGFPKKLVESKINPLALIVGAANFLDTLITFREVPQEEVGKELMVQGLSKYPLQHLQNLQAIVKESLSAAG